LQDPRIGISNPCKQTVARLPRATSKRLLCLLLMSRSSCSAPVTLTSVNPCLWITKNLPKKLKNSEWGMDKQQSDTESNCASPSSLQHELCFGTLWKMFRCTIHEVDCYTNLWIACWIMNLKNLFEIEWAMRAHSRHLRFNSFPVI
jgi:hypothetical protein